MKALLLSYAGCGTCKKAIGWLRARKIDVTVRPIVDEPPSPSELSRWIPASRIPLKKWLNTSGQSYRAIGKVKVDAASEEQIAQWLSKDGKLVKRPVLVLDRRVLVGFDEAAYAELFSKK